jgi:hypothetical protein
MANYGTAVYKSNGVALVNQGLAGGTLYIDTVVMAVGYSQTFTYSNVPGGAYLRVMLVQAGAHTFSIGTNGSGQATVTFTYASSYASSNQTIAFVFATQTNEPTYGVSLINDAGERLVSTLYPVPEFLGTVTTSGSLASGYWTASTSLGAGRKRMILWKIPDTTYISFQGNCYVSDSVTGSYTLTCKSFTFGGSESISYAPVAYVFALTGLTAGSESYGMRVYNGSGAVTFCSGRQMMSLLKAQTYDFGYTLTISEMSGITPILLLPSTTAQTGGSSSYFAGYDSMTGDPLYGYILYNYYGTFRKNGTVIYTAYDYVDAGNSWTPNDFYNGQDTGLLTVVSNSANYS